MSTRLHEQIAGLIRQVLDHKGIEIEVIDEASPLSADGLGLDSLDLAELSALLEQEFGHDPYSSDQSPQTVGDVVAYYHQAPPR